MTTDLDDGPRVARTAPVTHHRYAAIDRWRVVAPDYPGYGQSEMPARDVFAYTFDRFAELVDGLLERLEVRRYAMYVMDYGASVGWRLAAGGWR